MDPTPAQWEKLIAAIKKQNLVPILDNAYQGYGYEDWDFMTRLENLGRRAGYLPRRATVAHLWHNETEYDQDSPARRKVEEVATSGATRAEEGLSSIPESESTQPPENPQA